MFALCEVGEEATPTAVDCVCTFVFKKIRFGSLLNDVAMNSVGASVTSHRLVSAATSWCHGGRACLLARMEQEARDAEWATGVRALRGGRRGNAYGCRLRVHVRPQDPVWELVEGCSHEQRGRLRHESSAGELGDVM